MSTQPLSLKLYVSVYLGLLGLLALTTLSAFFPLGFWNTFINTAVSVSKAALVILFFMHVRYSSKLVWVFAAAAFYWIGILYVLTMNDYISRGWLPPAGK